MTPSVHPTALKKTKLKDWLLRFIFGGAVTVGTGLVAHVWGPSLGGIFLAFPAILPATLTLAKQREGRQEATEDARGSGLGALALIAFAAFASTLLPALSAAIVLPLALTVWVIASVGLWWMIYA